MLLNFLNLFKLQMQNARKIGLSLTPEEAVNLIDENFKLAIDSNRNLVIFIGGSLVAILGFLGTLMGSKNYSYLAENLKYPLIILIIAALCIFISNILLIWYKSAKVVNNQVNNLISLNYFLFATYLGYFAILCFMTASIWFILIITNL